VIARGCVIALALSAAAWLVIGAAVYAVAKLAGVAL
jgi:hypothetical protein